MIVPKHYYMDNDINKINIGYNEIMIHPKKPFFATHESSKNNWFKWKKNHDYFQTTNYVYKLWWSRGEKLNWVFFKYHIEKEDMQDYLKK